MDGQDKNFIPTVLVVDDNAMARSTIATAMIDLGVNIVEADNGRAALSILKRQSVNLVISDLIMPKMSGLMLLHSLLEQGRHLPFIIVTSYSDKDSAIQALRLGAFDYLEKPIDIGDLQTVAKEAIAAGLEQQSLIKLMNTPEGRNKESFALAEMQILRMRTFRAKSGEFDSTILKGNINNWYDLRNFFVTEAEQQLVFCMGAVDSLGTSENINQDLGFVLRIVQSIRLASESIRLTDISEFAWTLELNIAAFKSSPDTLAPEYIKLMHAALSVLESKIGALQSTEAVQIQKHLERITNEVRDKASLFRSRKNSA